MMLALSNIHKSYYLGPVKVDILKGVSLEVERGDLLSIVGKSGCGKSTLMNIIGLLDEPDSGQYVIGEREMSECNDREKSAIRNQKIGFVFQQYNLLPKLTAVENVALPLIYRGMGRRDRESVATEMLGKVDMADRGRHRPMELSGGQQQRVAIARALAGSPAIIIGDEPTGALDPHVGAEIMELFKKLNEDESITFILITHDLGIARQCKRAVEMKDGVLNEMSFS